MAPQSLLTQDEVEALLELVESGKHGLGDVAEIDDAAAGGQPVLKRDFSKPDKLPREEYRWFQGEATHAGTRAAEALARWLEMDIRMECVGIEIQRFQAFTAGLASPCVAYPVACGNAQGVLAIDPPAVLAAVDRVLGGTGKSRFLARTLTTVELPMALRFATTALQALADGLSDVVAMAKEPAGPPALHTRQARFVPPDSKCLVLTYSIAGEVQEAEMKLAFPATLFQRKSGQESSRAAAAPPPALPSIGVDVAVRLAETTIRLRELLALERGDV